MRGNLSGWKPKFLKKDESGTWKFLNKWAVPSGVASVVLTAFIAIGTLYNYIYPINKPTVNDVVSYVQPTVSVENARFAANFSDSSLKAELIIPNQNVEVYKLVKITTTKIGSFYDLLVMTVSDNQISFVETVETKDGGWVFTGAPGQYSLRLTVFDPQTGFTASTGKVVIGNPVPPPSLLSAEFSVSPSSAKVGEPVTLTWTTKNATQSYINGQPVELNGSKVVSHNTAGEHPYTLTLNGANGQTLSKDVRVTVTAAPGPGPLPEGKYGFGPAMHQVVVTNVPREYWKYAASLADNFEGIAAQAVSTSSYATPNDMNKELGGRNRQSLKNDQTIINAWMPFFQAWTARANTLISERKLPGTVAEYAVVYRETASALRQLPVSGDTSFEQTFKSDHLVYERYKKAFND